jgi:predicted nucleic acid-binding protein
VRYLVDSDWIVDATSGILGAVAALNDLRPDGLAVSVIAVCEVYEGAHMARDPLASLASFRRFLADYILLDLTEPIAGVFAGIRASLRRQGNLIQDLDLLIAATAIYHDLELVTRNLRHFERVPGLKLYRPSQT